MLSAFDVLTNFSHFKRKMRPYLASLLLLNSPYLLADNQLTDTFLQPFNLKESPSSWSLGGRIGIREGSSQLTNEGVRLELPRLIIKKNIDEKALFTASIPYIWLMENGEESGYSIGDPSFLTTLAVSQNSTITVGVTEPAANRPYEPDVVRFFGFYTIGLSGENGFGALQVSVEIPDKYFEKGQDDILSFGLALGSTHMPIRLDVIHKQVVESKWWDITQPAESPINRTNITLSWTSELNGATISKITGYIGSQLNGNEPIILGVNVAF